MKTATRTALASTAPTSEDLIPAGLEPVFEHRPATRGPRHVAVRRPRAGRPAAAMAYRGHRSTRTPVRCAPQRVDSVEQAQVGYAVLAAAALLSALVVAALIGLAHWRAGLIPETDPAPVPVTAEYRSVPGENFPR